MTIFLTAQRWVTAALAVTALFIGTVSWGPVAGLWLAAWVIGLLCVGIGAAIHEFEVRRQRPTAEPSPPDEDRVDAVVDDRAEGRARAVKLSGFGYLTAGMLAGVFPPVMTVALLTVVLVNFLAGHQLIGRLAL